MLTARLGLGPMSLEIIESVYKYSSTKNVQLMLISSMNQINYEGGYVNGWTTEQYTNHLKLLKAKYPKSNIKICRDHCGPNHAFQNLDPIKCIEDDIRCGYDLIHIDWSKDKDNLIMGTKFAMNYALGLNPEILLEIGSDPIGAPVPTPSQLESFLQSTCGHKLKPEFVVVNTGSLVKDYNQAGTFDIEAVTLCHDMLKDRGIKLKEHNADYLSPENIKLRQGIVDAMNVAPQLGVIQTMVTLYNSWISKVHDPLKLAFIEGAVRSKDWKQWEDKLHDPIDHAIMAGHYRFNTSEYKSLVAAIYNNNIEPYILEVVDRYVTNQETLGSGRTPGNK